MAERPLRQNGQGAAQGRLDHRSCVIWHFVGVHVGASGASLLVSVVQPGVDEIILGEDVALGGELVVLAQCSPGRPRASWVALSNVLVLGRGYS